MLQNLSISIQSFSELRGRNCVYVDKTQHIHRLVTQGKCYFLSRPRRFGKSLTISTIAYLYQGRKDLFEGLWIENNWDWTKKHPIVHISFNTLSYAQLGLEVAICGILDEIAKDYSLILSSQTAPAKFRELLKMLYASHGKVVLLIDEYDKPLIDFLQKEEIEIAKENRKILKQFYSVIKNADEQLEFMLITGVSKFSQVSIFSDLNHVYDISLSEEYSTLVGYTFEELQKQFKPHLAHAFERFPKLSYEEFLAKIKLWYNGYSWDTENYVYNPFSILNFLRQRAFSNYWFGSGTPTFLINLLRERGIYNISNFSLPQYSFDNYDLENLETVAILFQTGYLTIKSIDEDRIFELGYPNYEVEEAMMGYLLAGFKHSEVGYSLSPVLQLRTAFQQNDLPKVRTVLHTLFKDIPYELFRLQSELYYHALVHLMFRYLGIYVQSEVQTSDGRMDAVVTTATHLFILEFKINQTAQTAIDQIKEKDYAANFALENKTIIGVGINFSQVVKGVDDFDWEIIL